MAVLFLIALIINTAIDTSTAGYGHGQDESMEDRSTFLLCKVVGPVDNDQSSNNPFGSNGNSHGSGLRGYEDDIGFDDDSTDYGSGSSGGSRSYGKSFAPTGAPTEKKEAAKKRMFL